LFRMARGVHKPHKLTEAWVRNAIKKVVDEELHAGNLTISGAASIVSLLPKENK